MLSIIREETTIFSMIDRANLSEKTKHQYRKALSNYLKTGNTLSNAEALSEYAQTLPKSSKSFLKAAIRLWGKDIIIKAKSGATPENVNAVQATVFRVEALNESIQVQEEKGQKFHTWLTQAEVKKLLSFCDGTLTGKRDRIVLSILVGAGLRRDELTNLKFEDIKKQGDRSVLQVIGKGSKLRSIPIAEKLSTLLDEWYLIAGDGFIARSLGMKKELGESLSGPAISKLVSSYGERIGKPFLAPHDLRRTFSQLGYEAGVSIIQISRLLGHSSIATTQRYLNLELDLKTTVSDFIPL